MKVQVKMCYFASFTLQNASYSVKNASSLIIGSSASVPECTKALHALRRCHVDIGIVDLKI